MENWQGPAETDIFDSSQVRISDSMMKILPLSGIPFAKAGDFNTVPLNRDSVQTWIVALGKLLAASNKRCTKNDSAALHIVNDTLMGASFIMGNPAIQKILCNTPSLAKDFDGT